MIVASPPVSGLRPQRAEGSEGNSKAVPGLEDRRESVKCLFQLQWPSSGPLEALEDEPSSVAPWFSFCVPAQRRLASFRVPAYL